VLEVLATSVALPTLIFTALLALSMAFWGLVLAGAVDLDGSGAEGAAKGALEGAAKGAMEGAAKGALEGAAKGAAEAATHGSVEGATKGATEGSPLAQILLALGFHRAPATLILSLFSLFGWLTSTLLSISVAPSLASLPGWLVKALIFLVSSVVAFFATSVASRPVAPLFTVRNARKHEHLVGQVATVSTGRVDGKFGQAKVELGGAELILEVRHSVAGMVARGDRVLIVAFDAETNAFEVEPMEPGRRIAIEDDSPEQDADSTEREKRAGST
jgi:hypothetical protein